MKHYTADRRAQRTLQLAIPLATAMLLILVWYFFSFFPRWLLWVLTLVLGGAALGFSTVFLPLWFASVSYTISDTRITRQSGVIFVREQTMRTQALQYSTMICAPFSHKNGLNFIPLHAYGGTLYLAFLRRQDALEIQAFLQQTVYPHTPGALAKDSGQKTDPQVQTPQDTPDSKTGQPN